MLMHLKFCFESIPNEPTPATMLRYYRQRKELTTRQLAESVGIVPATLLMYEREKFPIPYQTAVAFAEKANICYGIYAKWETAVRQPSRKMYEQLVTTYPEIKI